MNDISVSIIILIYDVEKYLDKCIDSIRHQDLRNIEIILATDGPVQCDAICQKHAIQDDRVLLVMHAGSYGKSFNEALEIARGEYIGIVEADDWCGSNMFSNLYNRGKAYEADIVKGGFIEAFDEPSRNRVRLVSNKERCFFPPECPHYLSFQPSVWSAIYKREFLIKNMIRMIEEKMSFIDAPFSVATFLSATKVVLVPDAAYYYYQCNPNQSIKKSKASFDGLKAEDWLYANIDLSQFSDYVLMELLSSTIRRLSWDAERLENPKEFIEKCSIFLSSLLQRFEKHFVLRDPKICRMAQSIGFPQERLKPPTFFGLVRSSGKFKLYFGEFLLVSLPIPKSRNFML